MKSNSFKILIIKVVLFFFLFSFYISVRTNTKKTESVMQFFNDMFLEEKSLSKQDNSTEAVAGNSTSSTDIFSDWMEISSPIFHNKKRFPPMFLDNKEINVKTDKDNFRINDAFNHHEGG